MIPAQSPSLVRPSLLSSIEARLLRPDDAPEMRLRKMIIFSFLALASSFHLAHGLFFASGGNVRTALANSVGCLVSVIFLALTSRARDPVPLWRVYTVFHLIIMTVINHLLGGLAHAQGSIIYVVSFSLVNYAADGPRAALVALLASLGLYAASVLAQPIAPVDQLIPDGMQTILQLLNMVGTTTLGLIAIYFYGRQSQSLSQQLIEEKELRAHESQALLENILPAEIARELVANGTTRPVRHEAVSILFTDLSGYTQVASAMPAELMVGQLNEIFAAFDDICDACGVEKIKTIGDAYMAVAGVPLACEDHAARCVTAGLKMLQFMQERNDRSMFKWALRVGIHSGPVVAGVVGKRKYAFDVWGDTVNIASRMESHGEVGRINVSAYTSHLISPRFRCEYRGKVEAKGKGLIDMYFVAEEPRAV